MVTRQWSIIFLMILFVVVDCVGCRGKSSVIPGQKATRANYGNLNNKVTTTDGPTAIYTIPNESSSDGSFLPNGHSFITGDLWGGLKCWDIATGQHLLTLQEKDIDGKIDGTDILAISADNKILATATSQESNKQVNITLWNLTTGKSIRHLTSDNILCEHVVPVKSLAFSPNGTILASGDTGGMINIWNMKTGMQKCVLKFYDDTTHKNIQNNENYIGVNDMTFSPDGSLIACATNIGGSNANNNIVELYNTRNMKLKKKLYGNTAPVSSIAFSPSGNNIVTGSIDNAIIIFDVITGTSRHIQNSHKGAITSVAFSHDGTIITGASDDIRKWDVSSGKLLKTISVNGYIPVAISLDGTYCAMNSNRNGSVDMKVFHF